MQKSRFYRRPFYQPLCRTPSTMSFQVRHFQPCSSRFRTHGFTGAKSSSITTVEAPAPQTTCVWSCISTYNEPKRRKGCPSAEESMDPSFWGSLPEDLIDKIASYMPFPGLLRARAVNKRLQDYIFSEKFEEARAGVCSWKELSRNSPYLLVFATMLGHRLCTAYDAGLKRWRCMPPMKGLPARAKDCVAGDGGLLCFRDVDDQGHASLFVYNPVSQECRELPPMPIGKSMLHHGWILTHMVYNRFTCSYKLMVLTKRYCSRACAHMEIYDSLTHTWTLDNGLAILERKYNLSFAPQVGACCDNFFYFVAKEGILRGTSVMGLVVYDIFEGAWREKLLYRCEPRCPGSKIEVQVVECKGTVYMVVREDDFEGTKGVSFCRLNPSKEQKIEDAVLFESFFSKWGSKFPAYRCVSVQNELGLFLYDKSFQVLVDDLSEELMLPRCPLQGLEQCVPSTSITRFKPPHLYYAKKTVISEVHYQPNAAALV